MDTMWKVLLNLLWSVARQAQVGAIVTHYHFDHVGGTPPPPFDSLGIKVPGVRELAVEDKVKVCTCRATGLVAWWSLSREPVSFRLWFTAISDFFMHLTVKVCPPTLWRAYIWKWVLTGSSVVQVFFGMQSWEPYCQWALTLIRGLISDHNKWKKKGEKSTSWKKKEEESTSSTIFPIVRYLKSVWHCFTDINFNSVQVTLTHSLNIEFYEREILNKPTQWSAAQ